MKLKPLIYISGFQLFPTHGFLPTSHPTISFASKHKKASATQRLHLREHHRPAAFASSTSRLQFTPKEDGDGDKPFIRPALHNSPFFRSLAILYALLFALYQGSAAAPGASTINALHKIGKPLILSPKAAATVHLLSFGTWFGTVVYTTFIAGITMFKNLPRRVFGKLQSKLFPLYFKLCSAMIGLQILTLTAMPDILSKTSEVSLAVAFFTTLLNLLYLEPESTRVMFDRYSLEDNGKKESDEYSKLAKSFGKLHGMSSLANLVALCGGLIHGVRLASGLAV